MSNQDLVELVTIITKHLVDAPDKVEVKEVQGDITTVLELTVEKNDIGKIIGKHGNTAKAIRTILSAVAAKNDRKAHLDIIE